MNTKVSFMKPQSQLLIHSDAFKPLSPFTTESLEDDTSWLPPHVLVKRAERSTHVSEPTYLSLDGSQTSLNTIRGSDRAWMLFTARRTFSSPDTVKTTSQILAVTLNLSSCFPSASPTALIFITLW